MNKMNRTDIENIYTQTIESRAFRKEFGKTLKSFKLIYGEFEILYLLLGKESLQPTAITALLNCQPAATSRIIRSLHQRNLLTYNHDLDDRRQVFVSLTASGLALIKSVIA
ncbi:MAG: MarR family winged helix-turn-helix transcriptional regulator [Gammaproteobacteria bacterium]